ncbi:hypothetical protein LSAT2_014162 [Lamellibrachia satsuma]|nr:hypothetical protein LSAT2_014162 [Lamellibrachia satsuma]
MVIGRVGSDGRVVERRDFGRWSLLSGVYARGSKRSHTGKWKKPIVDSVRPIELVISISKLTTLSLGLAAISCKGSIVSSIKHRQEKVTAILDFHVAIRLHLKNDPINAILNSFEGIATEAEPLCDRLPGAASFVEFSLNPPVYCYMHNYIHLLWRQDLCAAWFVTEKISLKMANKIGACRTTTFTRLHGSEDRSSVPVFGSTLAGERVQPLMLLPFCGEETASVESMVYEMHEKVLLQSKINNVSTIIQVFATFARCHAILKCEH